MLLLICSAIEFAISVEEQVIMQHKSKIEHIPTLIIPLITCHIIITIDKILRIFCFSFIKIPPLVCTFLFKLIIIQIKNSVKCKIKNGLPKWQSKIGSYSLSLFSKSSFSTGSSSVLLTTSVVLLSDCGELAFKVFS